LLKTRAEFVKPAPRADIHQLNGLSKGKHSYVNPGLVDFEGLGVLVNWDFAA
jgi:hypothetical protein